jgi:AraC-like DNA-binding protein
MISWNEASDDVLRATDDDLSVARVPLSVGGIDVLRGRRMYRHFAPHIHDFFAIGVIDSGRSRVWYRGSKATAGTGALVTISAGETHTGEPAEDTGWSYRMIYPERGLLRMALGDTLDHDETVLFPAPFVVDTEVRYLFDRAYASLVRAECELATEGHVLTLLRTVAMRHSSRPPLEPRFNGGRRIVAIAKEYLEAHFTEKIQLATLARVCEVSPFHLIRVFRRECGLPPHAYLKQIRIGRALALLQEGMLVSQVAYACGFSDQSHLTRNFKNTFGIPPGAYQRAVGITPRTLEQAISF